MNLIGWILIGIILLIGVWIIFQSRKRKWYKVYLANNDVLLLYRDIKERWWRTSDRYMRFKDEFGREITFPSNAHWVLMWEEVDPDEVEIVRSQIQEMKTAKAEEE